MQISCYALNHRIVWFGGKGFVLCCFCVVVGFFFVWFGMVCFFAALFNCLSRMIIEDLVIIKYGFKFRTCQYP